MIGSDADEWRPKQERPDRDFGQHSWPPGDGHDFQSGLGGERGDLFVQEVTDVYGGFGARAVGEALGRLLIEAGKRKRLKLGVDASRILADAAILSGACEPNRFPEIPSS
jgi:hypothetical protein